MGSRAAPRKCLVLDPMLGWANPPTVLCMIFGHVFGHDGFQCMVLEAMFLLPGIGCFSMYKYVL